jgi:hypothetical protein
MVLGFKTKFNGKCTYFIRHIQSGRKIHSIRKGNRWKPGNKIHFATGVRTKNYECFKEGICISVQSIVLNQDESTDKMVAIIDGKKFENIDIIRLSYNDGFDHMIDFESWFKPELPFIGQIIHWTNFKY